MAFAAVASGMLGTELLDRRRWRPEPVIVSPRIYGGGATRDAGDVLLQVFDDRGPVAQFVMEAQYKAKITDVPVWRP
jgi:hypothetical protein